jgi:hypothetical protein
VAIAGALFVLVGLISIITYKQGTQSFVEFQKDWGLQGRSAFLFGRFLTIVGGLMLIGVGLVMIFAY